MIHKILNRFDHNHVVDHNHNHHFRIGWINSGADGHILGRDVRLDRDVRHSPDARNCFGHCVDLECLHTNRNFDHRSLFLCYQENIDVVSVQDIFSILISDWLVRKRRRCRPIRNEPAPNSA